MVDDWGGYPEELRRDALAGAPAAFVPTPAYVERRVAVLREARREVHELRWSRVETLRTRTFRATRYNGFGRHT